MKKQNLTNGKQFISKGIVYNDFESSEGGFDLRRWLEKELQFLNVSYKDPCCSSEGIWPVRFNENGGDPILERFNGNEWIVIQGVDITTPTSNQLTIPADVETTVANGIAPVAFDAVTNATNYDVQYARNPGFTVGVITKNISGTSTTLNNLVNSTTYYVRVRAKANSYTTSQWSPTSVVVPSGTVPVVQKVFGGWSTTDPYPAILTQDNITYSVEQAYTANTTNLDVDMHTMPASRFAVIKVPATDIIRGHWDDTGTGTATSTIPDATFRAPFVYNGYRYYVTQVATTFDTTSSSRIRLTA